ncbi:hypothetical protein ACFLVC_05050 [Chloroflexota bacterium]
MGDNEIEQAKNQIRASILSLDNLLNMISNDTRSRDDNVLRANVAKDGLNELKHNLDIAFDFKV